MSWRHPTEADWDRERDYRKHEPKPWIDQRHAVAALIGECESIVGAGILTEPAERSLRLLIAKTCTAFEMPSIAERADV